MEVWDSDANEDDKVDNFTFPLSIPLNKFNISNSLTVQGHYRVGNLTLNSGNLTTDTTSCNSMDYSSNSCSAEGRCTCNSSLARKLSMTQSCAVAIE